MKEDLSMIIDLDERGWFCAHVEDEEGNIVFDFSNEDENGWPSDILWPVECGYMKHGRDVDGLLEYLISVGIASPQATLRLVE